MSYERDQARMKAGEDQETEDEFEQWLADKEYESVGKAIREYLWEAFIGGSAARAARLDDAGATHADAG